MKTPIQARKGADFLMREKSFQLRENREIAQKGAEIPPFSSNAFCKLCCGSAGVAQ